MKIAFDIDDVLADFIPALADYHNLVYDTNLSKEDFHSYKFWEVWGGTKEEAIKKVEDFLKSDYFSYVIPVKGSIDIINLLSQTNELVVVTSRPPYLVNETQDWIQRYFPNSFSTIHFTNNHYTGWGQVKKKSDLCLELSVDVIIEDSLEYSIQCAEVGIRTLLLDRPWNKRENLPYGILRVYSWNEILGKI